MDRSKQGAAPRSCMSKLPLKPRPISPANGRPMSPAGPQTARQQGARKVSATLPRPDMHNSLVPAPLSQASGTPAHQRTASGTHQHPRSMTPNPTDPTPMADSRPRSASVGTANGPTKTTVPTGPSPLGPAFSAAVPTRKPVPGQTV